MEELLKAISLVLEWHDENLSDGVNREYAIQELHQAYEASQQEALKGVTMNYQDLVTEFFHMNADSPFPNHAQMTAIRQFAGFLEERAAQKSVQPTIPQEEPLRDDEFSSWDDDPGYWCA